jgi:hypothetical protein
VGALKFIRAIAVALIYIESSLSVALEAARTEIIIEELSKTYTF